MYNIYTVDTSISDSNFKHLYCFVTTFMFFDELIHLYADFCGILTRDTYQTGN